jgi:hypothetical protein
MVSIEPTILKEAVCFLRVIGDFMAKPPEVPGIGREREGAWDMEALGSGLWGEEQSGRRPSGSVRPTPSTLLLIGLNEQELPILYFHCTLRLRVAVLLAMSGSGVSDIVAAFR